jgi:hypothetical protein
VLTREARLGAGRDWCLEVAFGLRAGWMGWAPCWVPMVHFFGLLVFDSLDVLKGHAVGSGVIDVGALHVCSARS